LSYQRIWKIKDFQMSSTEKEQTGQRAIRILINILVVIIVGVAIFLAWDRFINNNTQTTSSESPTEEASATPAVNIQNETRVDLPVYDIETAFKVSAINRSANLSTDIPTRPRVDVITYTVETGDSLFSIADDFNLKPETLLWGNYAILKDDPHVLRPGQTLNVLPTDGTYYQWDESDNLDSVADFFGVEKDAIVEYPGNRFDLALASTGNIEVQPGTWLIVPGGQRETQDWGPPAISRDNPASARYYGAGHCGTVYTGAVGTGTFVKPTPTGYVGAGGYVWNPPVHNGVDYSGSAGDPIYAVDSGVVVYSGWSDYGYGNLIVIDHGNGWVSAYAHLNDVYVYCGQSVFQGATIGPMGSTGNSTGPHLHFELSINGAKVNPLNYIY
jgi:murein DD-endopeptidase MepM/ murein hydrolase activator NlpD